ncbi:ion transporter [Psychromonas sp. psych-6C06]|uniref:ion transporter n=1 Tax=Psychromonas sp. psych-6C06 TaxID=2058089 RepID=UPI000C343012|nr:ion transporter [Psychromonas sp. psych-6C06]PKF60801.1 ion transporter [Psychromonas sp. psych-6C06]
MTEFNKSIDKKLVSTGHNKLQRRFYEIRNNKIFEFFVISIIIFSALMIGANSYEISPTTMQVLSILDVMITIIFLIEIVIRFIGEPNKKRFFHNFWNIFDTFIVVVSLIPIEDGEMAILGRLVRIFRVLRMVSIIPELRILINSLVKALPQLGYVMLLMFIIFYIYAAVGTTFFASINPELWGDISISLLTLFRVMTFEDWTDVMYESMTVYPLSWTYYLTFIFFTAFAFLNMVIGIVVNVLEQERQIEADLKNQVSEEPTMQDLKQELAEIKAMLQQQQK